MRKNKGFTLAEMIAVIAILMLLAILSTPFVKKYIDDAYNAKAITYMRQLNEARMNFEKDYPGITIGGGTTLTTCDLNSIYGQENLLLEPSILFACGYLVPATDLEGRYTFQTGKDAKCDICEKAGVKAVVSMEGLNGAGIYAGQCACMDSMNRVYKADAED